MSDAFDRIVKALAKGDVEAPDPERGAFGSNALRVKGKIFAMMVRGDFVAKLPKDRVAALIDEGVGRPFETGGRAMKEWIAIDGHEARWRALADEALTFVRKAPAKKKKASSRS